MGLYGIIGKALDHSPSPKIYNEAFKKLGLGGRYLPFQVEKRYLKNLILCMKLVDVAGLNVTIPFKEAVVPFLDQLDPSARRCGSVNTIVRKKNRFIGYNTDGEGFVLSLKHIKNFSPQGKNISILGAGGAARGIAAALADAGAKEIVLFNRHLGRAKRVALSLRKNFPKTKWQAGSLSLKNFRRYFPETNLLVQTTPLSLPWPRHLIHPKTLVIDIRLNTNEGLWMLAYQAHLNLKLWLSRSVDPKWLHQVLLRG